MDRGECLLGIINLHKPAGKTSHDMVSFVRKTLGLKRVGHAGTLDPDATGVLPVLVGKATSLSDLLTEKTKTYVATVRLGVETDTYDSSGQVTNRSDKRPTEAEICEAAKGFLGDISQVPPMYSAIKVGGKKLYELARKGETVTVKPREVTIYSLRCFGFGEDTFSMEVSCSKGTYIRSLCHDLGRALGTCACMDALVRTQSGPFLIENAYTPEDIEQAVQGGKLEQILLPPEVVLSGYPAVTLTEQTVLKIKNGLRMRPDQLGISDAKEGDIFRLYDGESLLCLVKAIQSENALVLSIEKTFFG
ncbi:MAG: tRNA pseudouridine(55) synthase TruB [Ruminococcaceae bacterium]|nr:tRNA pseudouridine(55) synthase TruB [Oscillospiraceae bacterium]